MDIVELDKHINEILNDTRDFPQFNQSEHAGVCSAGAFLVGALLVCNNAREGLAAGCNASGCEETPADWQIEEDRVLYLYGPNEKSARVRLNVG